MREEESAGCMGRFIKQYWKIENGVALSFFSFMRGNYNKYLDDDRGFVKSKNLRSRKYVKYNKLNNYNVSSHSHENFMIGFGL